MHRYVYAELRDEKLPSHLFLILFLIVVKIIYNFSQSCYNNTRKGIKVQKYKGTERFKYEEMHIHIAGGRSGRERKGNIRTIYRKRNCTFSKNL